MCVIGTTPYNMLSDAPEAGEITKFTEIDKTNFKAKTGWNDQIYT